jgi:hypothetical protein
MATIHPKLKLAFIEHHEDGPLLVVRRRDTDERLEMPMTPGTARLLLKQLTGVLDEALSKMERLT